LEPTILWVGRVKKYKRVEHIFMAYKTVKKRISNAKLIIVGVGDHLQLLKNYSKTLGLSDIIFTGWVMWSRLLVSSIRPETGGKE